MGWTMSSAVSCQAALSASKPAAPRIEPHALDDDLEVTGQPDAAEHLGQLLRAEPERHPPVAEADRPAQRARG